MKVVMLTRSFLFNPGEVGWTRVSEVDKALEKWLESCGLVGEKIEIMGKPDSEIIKVSKKQEMPPIVMKDTATPVKQQLANVKAKARGEYGKAK